MIQIDSAEQEIKPFSIASIILIFSKPGAHVTHNATQPLRDITGAN